MDNFLFQQQLIHQQHQQLALQQHQQHVQHHINQQHQQLVQHHIDQHQRFIERSRQTRNDMARRHTEYAERARTRRRLEAAERLRKNHDSATYKYKQLKNNASYTSSPRITSNIVSSNHAGNRTRNSLSKKLLIGAAVPGAGLGASLYAAHHANRARKVRNAALLTAGIGAAGMASYFLTHD